MTVDAYLDMIDRKTAALIGTAMELGAVFAGNDPDVRTAVRSAGAALGTAFQIRDDFLGIWGDPDATGKSVESDIQKRKKTLPIVHAMTEGAPADRARLRSALADPDVPPDTAEIVALLERSGSHTYTESLAERYHVVTRERLADVPLSGLGRRGPGGSGGLYGPANGLARVGQRHQRRLVLRRLLVEIHQCRRQRVRLMVVRRGGVHHVGQHRLHAGVQQLHLRGRVAGDEPCAGVLGQLYLQIAIAQHVLEQIRSNVPHAAVDVLGGPEIIRFTGLGGDVAHVDLDGARGADRGGQPAHEQVWNHAGEYAPRTQHDHVRRQISCMAAALAATCRGSMNTREIGCPDDRNFDSPRTIRPSASSPARRISECVDGKMRPPPAARR